MIHEGDSGWYHQEPVQWSKDGATFTFMDRIIECRGPGSGLHCPSTIEMAT